MITIAGGIVLGVVALGVGTWLVSKARNLFFYYWKDGYYYGDRG